MNHAIRNEINPTPAVAFELARVPEVDLLTGLGPRRHAAILHLEPRPVRRWLPVSLAVVLSTLLLAVAFGR